MQGTAEHYGRIVGGAYTHANTYTLAPSHTAHTHSYTHAYMCVEAGLQPSGHTHHTHITHTQHTHSLSHTLTHMHHDPFARPLHLDIYHLSLLDLGVCVPKYTPYLGVEVLAARCTRAWRGDGHAATSGKTQQCRHRTHANTVGRLCSRPACVCASWASLQPPCARTHTHARRYRPCLECVDELAAQCSLCPCAAVQVQ